MKVIEINNEAKEVVVSFSEDELYVMMSIAGELFANVCINIDDREFQNVRGISKNELLEFKKSVLNLYDTYSK